MKHKKIFSVIVILFSILIQSQKSFSQTAGDSVFSSSQIHTIYLQFSQTGWWDSLLASHTGDYYINGDAIIDGQTFNNIGVKLKGNSSFNNPSIKKSLKIDFNNYDTTLAWNGLKKINLNNGFKDPTFLREKVCLDFMNTHGVYSPRCTFANVYLNGQLRGLYTLVEEVDKTFLKDRFSNKSGNLFKGDPHGDLKYLGANVTSYYPNYELHTNETANDWNDLVNLISILNNTPAASLESSLGNVFDLPSWYPLWASNILFANLDSYQGSGHNYFIYHNAANDQFEFIAWDVNEAFGNFQQGMTLTQIKNLSPDYLPSPSGNRPLEEKLVADANMHADYYDALYFMLANGFDTTSLFPLIDSLADWIRPSVYADNNKFFTSIDFEKNMTQDVGNIPALKPFIPARINAVLPVLLGAGYFPLSADEIYDGVSSSFQLFPNPSVDYAYVTGEGKDFDLFSVEGKWLKKISSAGTITKISLEEYSSGIYLVKNDKGEVQRLVVLR